MRIIKTMKKKQSTARKSKKTTPIKKGKGYKPFGRKY